MTDYIDRDELVQRIEENYCKPCRERGDDYYGIRCRACGTGDTLDLIEDFPSAVVTCENCKYNNACMLQMFVESESKVPFDRSTFFCADAAEVEE